MKVFGLCLGLVVFFGEVDSMGTSKECVGNQTYNKVPENNQRNDQNFNKGPVDIYVEVLANCTWIGEDYLGKKKLWSFFVEFDAEKFENAIVGESLSKRLNIQSYCSINTKNVKGYKFGVKPLEHQKLRIKYERDNPTKFIRIGKFKCINKLSQTVELDL